ncbi:GDSL-type esterase/lipase family protein [Longispora albida]|uniref:GDSL-type esterase/lipase family protein n=1 Tax=Longispora albida TaxID=203523 RepID=UPI0004756994|nr:GDSL-type esterase/lipase family protein [Longispora albida]
MILNPAARTIVCFGDSNTHGHPADDSHDGRWPADQRWTGQLQAQLGPGYRVIEEGLNSRTTDLDYAAGEDKPGRNGRAYLLPCLHSHAPVGTLVLMLGTNDLKLPFGRTAADIAAAIGGLIDDAKAAGVPDILVLAPIPIDPSQAGYEIWAREVYGDAAASPFLAAEIEAVALGRGVRFADAGTVAGPGDDGVHLTGGSHARLATLVATLVKAA